MCKYTSNIQIYNPGAQRVEREKFGSVVKKARSRETPIKKK